MNSDAFLSPAFSRARYVNLTMCAFLPPHMSLESLATVISGANIRCRDTDMTWEVGSSSGLDSASKKEVEADQFSQLKSASLARPSANVTSEKLFKLVTRSMSAAMDPAWQ